MEGWKSGRWEEWKMGRVEGWKHGSVCYKIHAKSNRMSIVGEGIDMIVILV